jgi:hypothetical protein
MKQTLTFTRSIMPSTESKMDISSFDLSLEAFDKKEYVQSFYHLLNYINPTFREKYGNVEGTEFYIPHGSIIVSVKIKDDQLKIAVPFLSLPEKGKIPMLRQLAGLNFNYLNMIQIKLREDNRLFFEYACPIDLVEPYKIYDVLEDICYTGDRFDDEFMTKFGAQRIYEPRVSQYDDVLVDNVYQTIQASCTECLEAINYFEGARKYGYAWNIASCAIFKMLYYVHPQGQLMNDLNKAIRDLDRTDIPLADVAAEGKAVVERLKAMPKEELAKELYYTETFIPPKRRSVLKNIQENFSEEFNKATNDLESGSYMNCCVRIVYEFYRLYFYNNVQDDVNNVVVRAMEKSSAKSWEKAAPILHDAMSKIMDGDLSIEEEEDTVDNAAGFDMAAYMNAFQQNMQNINMQEFAQNMQNTIISIFGQNTKK